MKKMNVILNVLMIILFMLAIAFGFKIFSKYYNNHLNENDIEEFISNKYLNEEKTKDTNNSNLNEDNKENDYIYKGYKVIGIIKIEKVNIKYPIIDVNKNKDEAMSVSVIKFSGKNLNEVGNITIAGHNYYDNTMFAKIHKLDIGDVINIMDNSGRNIDYQVFDKYSTSPMDTDCLNSVQKDKKEITLITCSSGNAKRLVIKAREVI